MKLLCLDQHLVWRRIASPSSVAHRRLRLSSSAAAAAAATAAQDVDVAEESRGKHLYYELHPSVQRDQPKVGAFQQLPMVAPSDEILDSSFKRAKRIEATKGISNLLKRERNRGAKQLDFLTKALSAPLKTYITKFPQAGDLHAYEKSLLELSLGKGKYEELLNNVRFLHKKIVNQGKNMASLCAKASTKREALDIRDESFTKMEEVFKCHAQYVEDLKEAVKVLRHMPVANPRSPILCLVGAPNVGKSSLVRVLSSGKPEVCDYPFTTRGITMGHIIDGIVSYQVTDTPGLLRRPDDERNDMEKLTLSALAYLPTAVLFVHDLTGQCGTSVESQFYLYKEIRERFPRKPWVDAVSKADLLEFLSPFEDHVEEIELYKAFGPPGALRVSVETDENIEELSCKVRAALETLLVQMREDELEVAAST